MKSFIILASSIVTLAIPSLVSAHSDEKIPYEVNIATSNSEVSKINADLVTPTASSGWQTKNGVTARVYTDRTATYPASDSYIGITAEKSSPGATYYELVLGKKTGSDSWVQVWSTSGTFASSSTGQYKVDIDNIVSKYSQGTFMVRLKIYAYGDWDTWLGDWETEEFVVLN
ncbi:hypothetical protein [Paenibacillus sp. UNC499MF]|uniref:hypothetical protein n=1 Tax=Paenibacillus sp. UNC499MF TaxID=1502751 RepID=UPI0008A08434|nr:hypothetical protein [Paenibacillus sp. UNC499MF]SEF51460.1 hypothetical protein SAMN02799616_00307 [Paenibacillus sp. UNC499MF]